MRYRKKPAEISAIQYLGPGHRGHDVWAVMDFMLGRSVRNESEAKGIVQIGPDWGVDGRYTLMILAGKAGAQGLVPLPQGHWVAKGAPDDFWPIDGAVFVATYEPVVEEFPVDGR